ncbi:integral membrane sensor signal transduction histidine kinase [Paenibacillus curdlanolyticus YK9]|uniref:histidine kinase n=1 Tax=Paenibacillus curdlanolyticus YK9 TaxID=717606 RepID=E0I6K3_9BACL|nr:HAMP domain-containing sensor histidine kinase [Paenibacillus curdlanolyticus]EFM11669.1 integral membrane sensor signal transduction histidine kinase [Paenibacillus curdlanolyticus YK9]
MTLAMAILWITALLLLLTNRRSPVFRWLSLVAFCGGIGALASVMESWIVAYETTAAAVEAKVDLLRHLQRGCSWMSYYGLPYSYLMFAAAYHTEAVPRRMAKMLPFITLIPPVIMLVFPAPANLPVSYMPLACWAIPYSVLGTLIVLTKRATHPAERRAHLIVTAAVLPAVLFAVAMNYMLPVFGVYRMWRYNVWSIPVAFSIFVVSLFKYGFLGVQLMIERRRLDSSMRAITSGTAMLNHAIKNDIAKIKLFADHLGRSNANAGAAAGNQADAAVIMRAAEHIETMIRSVHERTQELVLRAERVNLAELVRMQVGAISKAAEAAGVHLTTCLPEAADVEVVADAAQTEEAIHNVLRNALEAMPEGGQLMITLSGGKRGAVIAIRDTGIGIERQHLQRVTEPFFTTKSGKEMNFGLGLAYSSQLMNRQGGELRVESERGSGTTVTFSFPSLKRSSKRVRSLAAGESPITRVFTKSGGE